jgi:hypothetical protein
MNNEEVFKILELVYFDINTSLVKLGKKSLTPEETIAQNLLREAKENILHSSFLLGRKDILWSKEDSKGITNNYFTMK